MSHEQQRDQADPLLSELRILDWIFYQVCGNEIKEFERL
jgi:hypothetical protein